MARPLEWGAAAARPSDELEEVLGSEGWSSVAGREAILARPQLESEAELAAAVALAAVTVVTMAVTAVAMAVAAVAMAERKSMAARAVEPPQGRPARQCPELQTRPLLCQAGRSGWRRWRRQQRVG